MIHISVRIPRWALIRGCASDLFSLFCYSCFVVLPRLSAFSKWLLEKPGELLCYQDNVMTRYGRVISPCFGILNSSELSWRWLWFVLTWLSRLRCWQLISGSSYRRVTQAPVEHDQSTVKRLFTGDLSLLTRKFRASYTVIFLYSIFLLHV